MVRLSLELSLVDLQLIPRASVFSTNRLIRVSLLEYAWMSPSTVLPPH